MDHQYDSDEADAENATENMKDRLDTKDLSSIMGRFFSAVSWRNE
jgi:hypothetical protein